jgi:hypothetical protein
MKKLYQIVLKGNEKVWVMDVMLDPEDIPAYQEDILPIMRYPFTTWRDEWRARLLPRGKLYGVDLEGEEHRWSFPVYLTETALAEMKADGVDCFYEIANVIPKWVVDAGFTRVWCFGQDLFNFRWRELFLPKDELL